MLNLLMSQKQIWLLLLKKLTPIPNFFLCWFCLKNWERFNDQIQFVTNLDMHITDQIWSTNGNCQSFKKVLLASRLVLNRQLWQLLALHLCAPFLEMKSVWLVSKAFIDFSPVVYSYFLCSKEPDHDQRERERDKYQNRQKKSNVVATARYSE